MRSASLILALTPILVPRAGAADLTRVERHIAREPAYRTGAPKYCLLVFGPEAKTRVWLVLDGDTLYVDRNGNGDLTEAGEKVAAKAGVTTDPKEGIYFFEAGAIHDGKRTHKNLQVLVSKLDYHTDRDKQVKDYLAKDPKARGYSVGIDLEMRGFKGRGIGGRVEQFVSFRDIRGILKFADRPGDAPVIHFGGPWQVTLFESKRLTAGRETELVLGVGTPGLGAGTFAYVAYEGVIPKSAYPRVEITYPPRRPGVPPLKELYELKDRC
jgi:hypothetical protein